MMTIEKKSLKVGKYVDTNHVDTVVRNYKQTRWVHNSERIGKEDSLTLWYSIEELEEFIEKSKLHGADGIRFHFASYPDNYAERPEYASRQTMVLVATKSKETKNGIVNKSIHIGTEEGSTILAYNSPIICPPTCPRTGGVGGDIDPSEIGITLIDRGDDGVVLV